MADDIDGDGVVIPMTTLTPRRNHSPRLSPRTGYRLTGHPTVPFGPKTAAPQIKISFGTLTFLPRPAPRVTIDASGERDSRSGTAVERKDLTSLINAWQQGDDRALDALMPHIYEELHRLATRQMRQESAGHTHQALDMKVPAELYTESPRPYSGLTALEYPFHDRSAIVTSCGRICYNRQKINLSTVFAGQKVGIKQVDDRIWLVSFMHYDLGYFDHEAGRLEPIDNPFKAKVLPMSPE